MTHTQHDVSPEDVIEGEIVATETTTQTDQALAVYVAGENLPDNDPERGAVGQGNALVPHHELSSEEVLHTFRAWMRLDVADGKASKETLRVYLMDVRQYLAWLQSQGLHLFQTGEEEVKAFRAFLLEPGAPARLEPERAHSPAQYALTTVGRKLGSVRRFYQMAYNRGYLPHNPAEGIRSPRDKTSREDKIKYLGWETVRALLAAPLALSARKQVKGRRDRAVLVLMALHGLRVVEVHRLNLEDIDLEGGESGTLSVFGKGDKWRIVHLTDATREELLNWLQVRDKLGLGDEPALFVTLRRPAGPAPPLSPGAGSGESGGAGFAKAGDDEASRRISVKGLRQMVNRYLKGLGVRQRDEDGQLVKGEGVSCHSLRHSFATHANARGAEIDYISKEMGHASVATTEVYRHLVEREKNNPAKMLTGLLD